MVQIVPDVIIKDIAIVWEYFMQPEAISIKVKEFPKVLRVY